MKLPPLTLGVSLLACAGLHAQTDSADYYFQQGIQEKTARRYLVASQHFSKATRFNPAFTAAYIENAYMHLEMRKNDQAMQLFSKVLDLEPANLQATGQLMELYYNYRMFAKARELAAKCSNCLNAEKIKAMCAYHDEDYTGAVRGLTSYLAKNPADAEATYTLARAFLDMEDYKSAIPWYHKAVVLNEDKNMWSYELGLLYYSQEDYKNAVVMFRKAAEKGYPQKSDFVENLGYALMFSGKHDEGEKLLLGLLEKRGNSKDMMRDMAEAFYKGRDYQRSLNYCQKLMELDMNDGKALFQAGLCFQKMGDKDKGQAMCDKAIEMDPSLNSLRQKKMNLGL